MFCSAVQIYSLPYIGFNLRVTASNAPVFSII